MITLQLTEQELQIILFGLGELKAKDSIDLIFKVKTDAEKQIKDQKEIKEN